MTGASLNVTALYLSSKPWLISSTSAAFSKVTLAARECDPKPTDTRESFNVLDVRVLHTILHCTVQFSTCRHIALFILVCDVGLCDDPTSTPLCKMRHHNYANYKYCKRKLLFLSNETHFESTLSEHNAPS